LHEKNHRPGEALGAEPEPEHEGGDDQPDRPSEPQQIHEKQDQRPSQRLEHRELMDRDREEHGAADPDHGPDHAHQEQRADQLVRAKGRREQVADVA
jgi:hypothetical protein